MREGFVPGGMEKETLRKEERIRRRREYLAIYQEAVRINCDHFTLLIRRNQQAQRRLGITASKKVGGAVTRNRVKRLIREFFRLNKSLVSESSDLVVIAKKGIPPLKLSQVNKEMKGALNRTRDVS